MEMRMRLEVAGGRPGEATGPLLSGLTSPNAQTILEGRGAGWGGSQARGVPCSGLPCTSSLVKPTQAEVTPFSSRGYGAQRGWVTCPWGHMSVSM